MGSADDPVVLNDPGTIPAFPSLPKESVQYCTRAHTKVFTCFMYKINYLF